MEARLNNDEIQFWEGIIEFIIPIKKTDEYENLNIIPEEWVERFKTLFESIVDPEDYKYERRKELFNKFITRIKINNHRLYKEWEKLDKEINLEFYKMRCSLERALKKKKEARARRKQKKAINQPNISGKEFLQAQK